MDLTQFVSQVQAYWSRADLSSVPGWHRDLPVSIHTLAQGEYNMNYVVCQGDSMWVFRVNIGTQIRRPDQILYEYRALRLLERSGHTPRAFYADDSRELLDYGVLVMEYLPGIPLDYRRDLAQAARLFAAIHAVRIDGDQNHLIREERPLTMTYEECSRLLLVYLESDLAQPGLRSYLAEVLDWADRARHREQYFEADPWPCIINTEVNSGNFIVNQERGTIHLVDWEKPLWGDPSQDLSHFCVPTTTLWKTDYRMSESSKRAFLDGYRAAVSDAHLRETIVDRVRLRDPFNCLRGISWSAMAWVAYRTGTHALRNPDTLRKLNAYMDVDFVRGLFDPYMRQE